VAIDVDRHDSGGARGDATADVIYIQAVGTGIAINKDGRQVVAEDRLQATDDGKGRQDHLGLCREIEDGDGEFQSHSAVANGHPMFTAAIGGPFSFETIDVFASGGDPA